MYSANIDHMSISGLHKLEVFNIENSGIETKNVDILSSFSSLRVINFRGNKLPLENDTDSKLFAKNHRLQEIIFSQNGLVLIPEKEFSHLDELQILDVSQNELTEVEFDLPTSGNLHSLLMNDNNIQTLPLMMRRQLDAIIRARGNPTRLSVDLSDNQLSCACKDAEFVRWIQKTKVKFTNSPSYRCQGAPTGDNLILRVDLNQLRWHCNPYYMIGTSVLSTLLVVALLIAGFVVYHKKYAIMHWKYVKFTRPKLLYDDVTPFKYDAFIVYNNEDKWWTHHTLLAEMEDKRNLKLCIYLRDFPAGGAYADVIDDAIKESRKTVLILSPKFFESNWCQHEMNMVHNKLVAEGIDLVELVILAPFSSEVMTSTLTQLMQVKPSMNWTDNQDGQKLFWDKLEDVIRSSRHFPHLA